MPTPTAELHRIVAYADRLLDTAAFQDWDGAWNGLQVENQGKIKHIAAVVDATAATVRLAAKAGANLMIAHHGLFWEPTLPWTGPRYQLLRNLVDHDIAVYSSHLPLDAHPRIGNNMLLANALGLRRLRPFFEAKGRVIGFRGQLPKRMSLDNLSRRLRKILGREPVLLPGGKRWCYDIGVVTGGAGSDLAKAAAAGVDSFVTGEGPHWTFAKAEELELNILYGGHYATETFGVKALAQGLARRFGLTWEFLDHPTGL